MFGIKRLKRKLSAEQEVNMALFAQNQKLLDGFRGLPSKIDSFDKKLDYIKSIIETQKDEEIKNLKAIIAQYERSR